MLLKYDFAAVNAGSIKTALRSIEAEVLRHNRRVAEAANNTQAHSAKGTGPGSSSAPATRAKEEERWLNYNAKLKDQHYANEARLAQKSARESEKAEKLKTRAVERESKNRAREEEKWLNYNSRLKDQHYANERRQAETVALSQARKAQQISSVTRGVVGGTVGTLASVGRRGLTLASVAGGALFATAVHGRMKDMKSASGLANQMAGEGDSAEKINASKAAILENAKHVRGFSVEEGLQAQRTFGGKAGDYGLGGKMLNQFADVSLATDVDINDVADVAANAYMKLKSEKPGQSQKALMDEVMEAVSVFAGQGNVGAVELKDLASYAGRLTAPAAKFEGPRIKSMARMGALAQIAIGSGTAASAEEATTAAGRFASDLTKHLEGQRHYKITESDIYAKKADGSTDKTTFKAIPDILKTMMVKTGGELPAMTKLMGEETKKMFEGISLEYNTAEKRNAALAPGAQQKKGVAGSAAIDKMFDVFEKAALSVPDRMARANSAMDEPSRKMEETFKDLQIAVADKLMPTVIRIIPRLEGLIEPVTRGAEAFANFVPKIESAVKWLEENPWKGLGAIIGVVLTKEIIGAGIGIGARAAIDGLIKLLIGGGGGGAAVGGAAATGGKGLVGAAVGGAKALGGAAVTAGLGTTAAVGSIAAIGLGSIAALGYQQGERKDEQKRRGDQTLLRLQSKMATEGVWGQAVAEEEANADLRRGVKRSMEAGGGTEQASTYHELQAQVKDIVSGAMAVPKDETKELAAAMRELAAKISTMPGDVRSPNRGETPTSWLGTK